MEGAAKLGSTVISIPLTMSKNDPVRRQGYHLLHGSVQPLSIPPISQPHVARHSAKRIKRAAKPDGQSSRLDRKSDFGKPRGQQPDYAIGDDRVARPD